MDADLLAYRAHIRTVNQPFKTVGGSNLHLIVNAFKNQVGDNAFKGSLFRLYQIDVFRTDYHVYRLVYAETAVHTGKFSAEDLYQFIMEHQAVYNVALADKIGYEGIFRLVVYLLRRAHLLDVALVHYDNRIGHGEGLFLIMGDINKCDSQLIFQPDQFVLHVLAQLEIQGSQRLVQKQDLRFVDDGAGYGDTLLLPAAQGIYRAVFKTIQVYQL